MDRKTINQAIIDEIIAKLQKLKDDSKIGVASPARFSDAIIAVDSLVGRFESNIFGVDGDR